MLNEANTVDEKELEVLEGIKLDGRVNVEDEVILDNVRSAIRRSLPQIRPQAPNPDRVALVGSGPSLEHTQGELVEAIKDGAKLVTVNGAYQWCLERNLFPKTQVVMDARASNARFVNPPLKGCRYVLASQCAPETFDAVADRSDVWIFHAAAGATGPMKDLLDEYYLGQWYGVGGGVTVITRAISMLRTVGYLRFDLFGVDSCFMNGKHHAFEQPENEKDKAFPFDVCPADAPEMTKRFYCAPWHAKQIECFLQMIKINGDHFQLNVHGEGLLAYALKANADSVLAKIQSAVPPLGVKEGVA